MSFAVQRRQMVLRQLVDRGIHSRTVVDAMNAVPREDFLPSELKPNAYEDGPLYIGAGQTISQPYIVALMMQALELSPFSVVLDVGSCTGYSAAVFAQVAQEVHTVERIPSLADLAKKNLASYTNVHTYLGDGTAWSSGQTKFDAIAVAAAAPAIPTNLIHLLNEGGKICVPVESNKEPFSSQVLLVGTWRNGELEVEPLCGVKFVPLIGAQGF